jgi:hypothetical protein
VLLTLPSPPPPPSLLPQNLSSAARAQVPTELWTRLLSIIFQQCHFPSSLIDSAVDDSALEEDSDNVRELRESPGTTDLLALCFLALGSEHFFHTLALLVYPHLYPALPAHEMNTLCEVALERHPPTLSSLDAAICLHAISMPHIKSAFALLVKSSQPSSLALSLSEQSALSAAPSPVILLSELLHFVLLHPQRASFPLLLHTSICQLIGGSVFLLSPPSSASLANQSLLSSPLIECGVLNTATGPASLSDLLLTRCPSLLVPTIDYLFCCLGAGLAVDSLLLRHAASQSLFRVFTHSTPSSPSPALALLFPPEFHDSVVLKFADLVEVFAQSSFPSAVLVQTLAQHLSRYPPEQASSHTLVLAERVRSLLEADLHSDSSSLSTPPRWFLSPNRVTLLLQVVSQFIRYSPPPVPLPSSASSPSAETPPHLELFLSHLWPSLDHIASTASQPTFPFSEPLDAVMSVYEEGFRVAPALFLREALVVPIASTCLRTACEKGLPSGLRCLRCLVEVSSFHRSQTPSVPQLGPLDQFVSELLTHLVETILQTTRSSPSPSGWLWIDDPEAVEALFAYLLQHLRSCSSVVLSLCLASEGAFAQSLMELSLRYLSATTDNEALRRVLQLLQALLSPQIGSAFLVPPSHEGNSAGSFHYSLLFAPLLPSLPLLLAHLFALLSGAGEGGEAGGGGSHQSIWSTLHEVLFALSALCCEHRHQAALLSALQTVFHLRRPLSLLEEQAAAVGAGMGGLSEVLSSEDRELVVEVCLQLGEQRNSRRFKSLVVDLARVCNRELEHSALQDYRA